MSLIQNFSNIFSGVEWLSSILDILFVTLIFYGIIKLVKDTKAIQLAKGFIFIIIMYLISYIFNMPTCLYLFDILFKNFLIILVVIFAPEIRNAIENLGRGEILKNGLLSIFNSRDTEKQKQLILSISEICSACKDMASDKIGALIVFERGSGLGNISDTGIILESKVSSELVKNIFYPKSPLHDGAMIIKNGKIQAAGCILPLTDNKSIESSFGTRHRAAIGISEQSDAIVLVVSEETGYISIADSGKLIHNMSITSVKEKLLESIMGTAEFNKTALKEKGDAWDAD